MALRDALLANVLLESGAEPLQPQVSIIHITRTR